MCKKNFLIMTTVLHLFLYESASTKSLYVIYDITATPTPVHAYDIQGNQLVFQSEYGIPYHGIGGVGIAIDTDSDILFITYENSNTIQLINARTMSNEGTVNAPSAHNLAGIVVDQGKKRVYTIDRHTNYLYVYLWDPINRILTLVGGNYIALPNVSNAFGLALDEINGHLYVADNDSNTIRYFKTNDWTEAGNFSVSQKPMGIALDVRNRYIYTGNCGYTSSEGNKNLLVKYDLSSGHETTKYMGSNVNSAVGIAVDQSTGFVYVTTGNRGSSGTKELLVFDSNLNQLYTTGNLNGHPTGLCVPGKDISYNPLNLSKDDGLQAGQGVVPGGQITYRISFDNLLNPTPVRNVTIVDTLPSGTTFDFATDGGVYNSSTNMVKWQIGTLAAGAPQRIIQFSLKVDNTVAVGSTIHNNCTIDSDDTPPTTQGEDTKVVATADFHLHVTPDTSTVKVGGSTSYQVSMDTSNGFKGNVGLTVSGYPGGVSPSFNRDSINVASTATLTIQTSSSTPIGLYNLIISGSNQTLVHADTVALVVTSPDSARIYPQTDPLVYAYYAGDEFWLDVLVGDSLKGVNNLYGVSFALVFDSDWLSVVNPPENNVLPGNFMGPPSDVLLLPPIIHLDTLFTSVSLKAPAPSVSGWGKVVLVKFKINKNAPDSMFCFRVIDPVALNESWTPIHLTPENFCISVKGWLSVWPGDTDDNGMVNQVDMLPIGLSWGKHGFARDITMYPNRTKWEAQKSRPWSNPWSNYPWPYDERYAYADANGDSLINGDDVLVIGLNYNWHQKHSINKEMSSVLESAGKGGTIEPVISDRLQDQMIDVSLQVKDVENVLGMGIDFRYPAGEIKVVSVKSGDIWGGSPLFLYHDDNSRGIVGIGVSRTRLEGGVTGSGCVVQMRLRVENESGLSKIEIGRAVGMDLQGTTLDFIIKPFEAGNQGRSEKDTPGSFVLYQNYPNPFNTSTKIKYGLPERSYVSIKVYDVKGNVVTDLADEEKEMGFYELVWDGRNRIGELVSSGIYYFRIKAGDFMCVKKGLLLK